MRRALLTTAAAIGLAIALAGCGGGKPTQAGYVKGNTSVLGQIPIYPQAKLTTQATTAYSNGKSASPIGYQTRYIYSLPASAKLPQVEGFYLSKLAGSWKQVASLTGPVLNYRKGKALISINLTEVKTHRLEIVVDKDFYSHVGG